MGIRFPFWLGDGGLTGIDMDKQWYVIHAYSGYETKVREALIERIERLGMDDFFGEKKQPFLFLFLLCDCWNCSNIIYIIQLNDRRSI